MSFASARGQALRSAILPVLLYGSVGYAVLGWARGGLHPLQQHVIFAVGMLVFWRYGWQLMHYLRAAWYAAWHYPRLRAAARRVAAGRAWPGRIFIVLPSYLEEAWVSMEAMQALMSNVAAIPCKATIVAAVGSDQDEMVI